MSCSCDQVFAPWERQIPQNIYTLRLAVVESTLSENEAAEAPSDNIGQRCQNEQDEGQEEVGNRALGIGKPQDRHMGPRAESDESDDCYNNAGSPALNEGCIPRRSEAHVKQSENGEEHEGNCIEDGDQEEIVAGGKEVQLQLMQGLGKGLVMFEHIHANRCQPGNAETE